MYRRTIRPFYSSIFRRITLVHQSAPCIYARTIRCCHNIPLPTSEWIPSAETETELKLGFSHLDPDEFGTLSKESENLEAVLDSMPDELGDSEEIVIRDKEGKKQRRPMKFYYHLIKDLLKEKKIVDAIDVLEVRMKKDGIKPDYYTYNLLINGCARVGYCLKAFKLYSQMKKNRVKRTPATYTGLFNACATSPEPADALMRLNNLRKSLRESRATLTQINYNVLMKAYARLNDIHSTFQVVDEMLSQEYTLNAETFCFLLQGCIADKENGMRHALLTWHKMRNKRVQPTRFTYNLLLRCVRDCDFGDEDEVRETINKILDASSKSTICLDSGTSGENAQKLLSDTNADIGTISSDLSPCPETKKPEFSFEDFEMVENRPNLLARKPYLGTIISIRSVKTPADRLLLLGGYKNLLKEMEGDGVKPDIKTFTLLLSVMPSAESAEKFLMKEIEKYNVFMDIDFCNMLMKQRALRFDYEGAKKVLSIIQQKYLQPDIITFGVMAMSCQNRGEVQELIQDMNAFSMRLNVEILGTMVQGACARFNFDLVIYLMKLTRKFGIRPNEAYMNHLEALQKQVVEIRRALRKKKPVPPHIERNKNFREDSLIFSDFFAQWKKEVEVFKSPHPYKQFWKPKENVAEIREKPKKDADFSEREDDDDDYTVPDSSDRESFRTRTPRTENERSNKWNTRKTFTGRDGNRSRRNANFSERRDDGDYTVRDSSDEGAENKRTRPIKWSTQKTLTDEDSDRSRRRKETSEN